MRLAPELKSKIDSLWDKFWSGGLSNPLQSIEQMSYLIFMQRLEEMDLFEQKRAQAKGIITVMAKYCEPHAIYYPHVMHRLKDKGIPELMLETEHGKFPRGQFRTRLEAFLEMIS